MQCWLGLILSLTCLVYCSKNGSSSSDFIVNATQRNLSCKDFLRNIEIEWEQWVVERRWQYWARHYRSRHQLMPVMAPQFAPPLSNLASVVNIFKVVGLLFAMSRWDKEKLTSRIIRWIWRIFIRSIITKNMINSLHYPSVFYFIYIRSRINLNPSQSIDQTSTKWHFLGPMDNESRSKVIRGTRGYHSRIQRKFSPKKNKKSGKIASSAKAGFVTFERSFIWCEVGGLAQVQPMANNLVNRRTHVFCHHIDFSFGTHICWL